MRFHMLAVFLIVVNVAGVHANHVSLDIMHLVRTTLVSLRAVHVKTAVCHVRLLNAPRAKMDIMNRVVTAIWSRMFAIPVLMGKIV